MPPFRLRLPVRASLIALAVGALALTSCTSLLASAPDSSPAASDEPPGPPAAPAHGAGYGLPEVSGTTYYVSPDGSDASPGTFEQPFSTITFALKALEPGDGLYLRGGVYVEQVRSPVLSPASADRPIVVAAYPGERPIIKGLLWIKGASNWFFDGINVTWDPERNLPNEHMVKVIDGEGWVLQNSELWGAHSFAALLIVGEASNWTVRGNYIHDTYPTNGINQDHLIYANVAGGGTIENNLLVNAANGQGVKVGPPEPDAGEIHDVTIRRNTIVAAVGPAGVQLAWGAYDTVVEQNIIVGVYQQAAGIETWELFGTGNTAGENVVWDAAAVLEQAAGLSDTGGNVMADPLLDSRGLPTSAQAQGRGYYPVTGDGWSIATEIFRPST